MTTQPIGAALRAHLAAQPAVAALLGDEIAAEIFRFYPLRLPQNPVLPAATYQLVSAPRLYSQEPSPAAVRARYQITIYAQTEMQVQAVATAIEAAMGGYSGLLDQADATCFVENVLDGFDPDTNLMAVTMDVLILHEQVVPA